MASSPSPSPEAALEPEVPTTLPTPMAEVAPDPEVPSAWSPSPSSSQEAKVWPEPEVPITSPTSPKAEAVLGPESPMPCSPSPSPDAKALQRNVIVLRPCGMSSLTDSKTPPRRHGKKTTTSPNVVQVVVGVVIIDERGPAEQCTGPQRMDSSASRPCRGHTDGREHR